MHGKYKPGTVDEAWQSNWSMDETWTSNVVRTHVSGSGFDPSVADASLLAGRNIRDWLRMGQVMLSLLLFPSPMMIVPMPRPDRRPDRACPEMSSHPKDPLRTSGAKAVPNYLGLNYRYKFTQETYQSDCKLRTLNCHLVILVSIYFLMDII